MVEVPSSNLGGPTNPVEKSHLANAQWLFLCPSIQRPSQAAYRRIKTKHRRGIFQDRATPDMISA
jgi:hypothetical protein